MKKKIASFLYLFLMQQFIFAQSFQYPSDYFSAQNLAIKNWNKQSVNNFTSFQFGNPNFMSSDSGITWNDTNRFLANKKFSNWLFNKNFISVKDSNDHFQLIINPIFDFRFFNSNQNKTGQRSYLNARGIAAECSFSNKVFVHTSFVENQAILPNYIDEIYRQHGTSIGEGRYKTFKKNGFDYASAQAYISYFALPQLSFQLGNGKQKVGMGYRSIWLSDMAFNYPYLKISFQDKKNRIQYNVMYALLSNLSNGGAKTPSGTEPLFQKKPASFQHLEWRLHKRFYLEFFQGVIWKAADTNNKLNVPINYINPIIYSHAAAYGLRNKNNVYAGIGWHAKLFENAHIYNYYTLDDIDVKNEKLQKSALQIGIKLYDAFGIKNLFLQSEYTRVSKFAFDGYPNNTAISHYNQPLAYGLQSNNQEWLNLLRYQYKRFFIEGELSIMKAIKSFDYDSLVYLNKTNYINFLNTDGGFNAVVTDNKNSLSVYNQTQKIFLKQRNFIDLKAGFIINPKYLLCLQGGITIRQSNNFIVSQTERIYYIGLSTRLYQRYWDN
jgi:hypothetical protein